MRIKISMLRSLIREAAVLDHPYLAEIKEVLDACEGRGGPEGEEYVMFMDAVIAMCEERKSAYADTQTDAPVLGPVSV